MPKQHAAASTRVPFAGFYHTKWDDLIDHNGEQHAEYEASERQKEEGIPEHLRLSEQELGEILFDVTDYSHGYRLVAEGYVEIFPAVFEERTGFKLALEWEEMTSPKYYNFETDRLFARAPLAHFYLMLRASRRDNHAALRATIKRMFTSYDGFISHYSNDLSEWLEKPLREWDHNELYTLVRATLEREAGEDAEDEIEWAIYENWADSGYREWSQCVDWQKYETKVAELRDDKAAEWATDNPDTPAPPYRCPDTLDLFQDWRPQ